MLSVVLSISFVFFFKQKTAYEMRISDWSSDVCSSDLLRDGVRLQDRITNEVLTSAVNVADGGDRRSLDLRRASRGHGRIGPGVGDHSAAELHLGIAVGNDPSRRALVKRHHAIFAFIDERGGRLCGEIGGGVGQDDD